MTGLDLGQLKRLVIAPTLQGLGPRYSTQSAINLLAGICNAESRCTYLKQVPDGPACGLSQMEGATHDDCWENFLRSPRNSNLATAAYAALPAHTLPTVDAMIWNLRYMVIMTRAQIFRAPDPLPDANDAVGMANYHKKFWNTSRGAADAAKNVPLFQQAIDA